MKRFILPVSVVVAAVLAGVGAYLGASGRLGSRRAQALQDGETHRLVLETVRKERTERPALDASLRKVADRTLGASAEATDSALRGRLNRIGEEIGLADLAVATEPDKDRVLTPARAEFRAAGAEKRLRDEPDFVEVRGSISGEGSLEQVMRLVHRIQVEPWIKRVDSVRFDPVKGGERSRVTVRLTTLFMEGISGAPVPPPSAEALAGFSRYQALAQRNPFRLPPPPKPAPPPAPPPGPAPPPPSFPWNQWKLTGRLDGPLGAEACLRNVATKATATLAPGARIGDAEFVRFEEDRAVFRQGEVLFGVELGATMADRQAVQP
ncbi:MAG: hypothetical protein U0574_12550 [Phycisphaerales bacterium]